MILIIQITSPMTLNISSFSNVKDLNKSVTPELSNKDSTLLHIWMNDSDFRMGGSCSLPDLWSLWRRIARY